MTAPLVSLLCLAIGVVALAGWALLAAGRSLREDDDAQAERLHWRAWQAAREKHGRMPSVAEVQAELALLHWTA